MAFRRFGRCHIDGLFGTSGPFHRGKRLCESPPGGASRTDGMRLHEYVPHAGGSLDIKSPALLAGWRCRHCARCQPLLSHLFNGGAFHAVQQPGGLHAEMRGQHAHCQHHERSVVYVGHDTELSLYLPHPQRQPAGNGRHHSRSRSRRKRCRTGYGLSLRHHHADTELDGLLAVAHIVTSPCRRAVCLCGQLHTAGPEDWRSHGLP